jgi:PAS domain-containing protein
MEATTEGVLILSAGGTCEYANDAAARLLGRTDAVGAEPGELEETTTPVAEIDVDLEEKAMAEEPTTAETDTTDLVEEPEAPEAETADAEEEQE